MIYKEHLVIEFSFLFFFPKTISTRMKTIISHQSRIFLYQLCNWASIRTSAFLHRRWGKTFLRPVTWPHLVSVNGAKTISVTFVLGTEALFSLYLSSFSLSNLSFEVSRTLIPFSLLRTENNHWKWKFMGQNITTPIKQGFGEGHA